MGRCLGSESVMDVNGMIWVCCWSWGWVSGVCESWGLEAIGVWSGG